MKRPLAILGSILLTLSFAARAVIVTPVDGVAGQAVVQGVYFAHAPAVRVTADDGTPIVGIQVDFIVHDGIAMFTDGAFGFSGDDFGITDSNGVATTAALMGYWPGTSDIAVTALTQNSVTVSIPLAVLAGGTARVQLISGDHQHAAVGTAYALPWVAQALDASGNVVPFAAIEFYATQDPTLPSVAFDGAHSAWVRADANGIAVSPVPTANDVSGQDEGVATTRLPKAVQSAFFAYHNLSAGGSGGTSGGGCGRQGKGNGDCGNSPAHSGGNGNNGNGKG